MNVNVIDSVQCKKFFWLFFFEKLMNIYLEWLIAFSGLQEKSEAEERNEN